MVDITWTDRQVYEIKMGRRDPSDRSASPRMSDDEINALAPKRAALSTPMSEILDSSSKVWKRCDLCHQFLCVNNWEDGKARTPKFLKFIVCNDCDPRHVDDRYKKEGYRIVFKNRLRIVRFAQVARALSIHGCINLVGPPGEEWSPPGCKCAGCASVKLFPTMQSV